MLLGWRGEWQNGEGQSMNKRFAFKADRGEGAEITQAEG